MVVDDYLHRPEKPDHLSFYDFVASHEKVCKMFVQMRDTASRESSCKLVIVDGMVDKDDGSIKEYDVEIKSEANPRTRCSYHFLD